MNKVLTIKSPPLPASKYHILALVGQGQFGKVFCALNRESKQLVALKSLEQKNFSTHKFLRELRFLLTLKHPNIVPCHSLEYFEHGRYVVMDYCEGGTLRDLMESRQLSRLNSLQLIADLLLGIIYCHHQGVIHCDIKPENILLNISNQGWIPRLSDFGISRSINDSNYSYSGYIGSPAYMAPERFYGHYSVSSDIYAIGILLFELIVGDRPFSGLYQELVKAHLTQPVNIPDTVPFLIRSTITKALQKLPQNRFKSAEEMLKLVNLALEIEKATKPGNLRVTNNEIQIRYSPFETIPLSKSVHYLTIDNDQIYQVTKEQLVIDQLHSAHPHISPEFQINLPAHFTQIHLTKDSAFIVVNFADEASLYRFNKNQIKPEKIELNSLFVWKKSAVLTAIDPAEKWLAIAKFSENSCQLQILKLPNLKPVNSLLIFQKLTHLFALDSRHGLAIFTDTEKTIFQLFTRRGNWLQSVSLPLILSQIIPSFSNPHRLFAVENNTNQGLIIELQPFRVTRVNLNINPNLTVAIPWGFVLAEKSGQVVLLNQNGQLRGYFQVSATITAIAPWGEDRLLLAIAESPTNFYYQIISLEKLDSSPFN